MRCTAHLLALAVVLVAGGLARAQQPLSDINQINQALAAAKPGDTVVIADGVYRDARITLTASGEAGRMVTLAPQTPGKVVFTGNSHITMKGEYMHVTGLVFYQSTGGYELNFGGRDSGGEFTARHCRLSHSAFLQSGHDTKVYAHMVEVAKDSTDNEIDHCYLGQSKSMSLGVRGGGERTKIHRNWFHNIVARSGNGQEAIQLGAAIDKPLATLVEHNLFDGACGDEEIVSIKSSGNIIRYNTFLPHPTRNKGALVVRHGNDNVIEGNYLFGVEKGIRVSGSGNRIVNNYIDGSHYGLRLTGGGVDGWGYLPAKDNLFAFNTIVNIKDTAVEVGSFMGRQDPKDPSKVVNIHPSGNRIYNNILIGNKAKVVKDPQFESGGNDYKQNLVASKATTQTQPTGPGLIQKDAGPINSDGRFRVLKGGPADGQAVALPEVTEDIDGRARASGGAAPTIGCDEASETPGTRRPLTPQDVGPEWMKGGIAALESMLKEQGL